MLGLRVSSERVVSGPIGIYFPRELPGLAGRLEVGNQEAELRAALRVSHRRWVNDGVIY